MKYFVEILTSYVLSVIRTPLVPIGVFILLVSRFALLIYTGKYNEVVVRCVNCSNIIIQVGVVDVLFYLGVHCTNAHKRKPSLVDNNREKGGKYLKHLGPCW